MNRRTIVPAAALTALLALAACGGGDDADDAAPEATQTGGFGATTTPDIGAEGTAPSSLPGVNEPAAGTTDSLGVTGATAPGSAPAQAPPATGADTAHAGH